MHLFASLSKLKWLKCYQQKIQFDLLCWLVNITNFVLTKRANVVMATPA